MSNSRSKDINYYLNLPYEVSVRQHEDPKEGRVFVARVNEIPSCMSHGKTQTEALKNVQVALKEWIEDALEDGDPVPEPTTEEQYSGRILLRMPPFLHGAVAEQASRSGVSINQFVLLALMQFTVYGSIREQLSAELTNTIHSVVSDAKWTIVKELRDVDTHLVSTFANIAGPTQFIGGQFSGQVNTEPITVQPSAIYFGALESSERNRNFLLPIGRRPGPWDQARVAGMNKKAVAE